jgi:hypothetical protein
VGRQLRALLTGALLVLIAVLVVDNHVMALPGGSLAEIGVARSVLHGPAAGRAAPNTLDATDPGRHSRGRSAHELHRCFVQARRSGQDPAACRVAT